MYISNNKKHMKIAIASTKNFHEKTLPILIPSLIQAGYTYNDIYIFIGGYDDNIKKELHGCICYLLDNNTFEFTALIGIVENNLFEDYWFLLHDTCRVGSDFKKKIENIPADNPEKIAIKDMPSMSIGAYKGDYLLSNKQLILSLKNKDYTPQGISNCKKWHVENEDFLLWRTSPQPIVYSEYNGFVITEPDDWYGTKTNRRTEYYPHIDLYKNKSNWGQTPIDSMIVNI